MDKTWTHKHTYTLQCQQNTVELCFLHTGISFRQQK